MISTYSIPTHTFLASPHLRNRPSLLCLYSPIETTDPSTRSICSFHWFGTTRFPCIVPSTSIVMPTPKYTNKKPPLTHFLCLPLLSPSSTPQLRDSLSSFKQSVCVTNTSQSPGRDSGDAEGSLASPLIPDKAFRPLGVLHLTLGVMSLRSEQRLEAAKDLLKGLDLAEFLPCPEEQGKAEKGQPGSGLPISNSNQEAPRALGTLMRAVTPPTLSRAKHSPEPMIISLRGLQAFPEPQKATVLYCPPYDPTSLLYSFCLKLKQKFVDAEFIEAENRPLVLHATIANTVYAKGDRRGEKKRMGTLSFNATEILCKYNEHGGTSSENEKGAFIWAEGLEIDRVRICEMGAKSVEDQTLGEEYKVVGERYI